MVSQSKRYVIHLNANNGLSALLPWVQFFHIYAFVSGVTLGYLLVVLLDAACLFCKTTHSLTPAEKRSRSFFVILLFYVMLSMPFCLLAAPEILPVSILNRTLKVVSLYFLILISANRIEWDVYVRSLKVLTVLACAVLLVQVAARYLFSTSFSFKLPFLKYANEDTEIRLSVGKEEKYRFRSIFTEPSHFVYMAAQYLLICIFDQRNQNMRMAVFVSVCILLSVSSTGYILLAVIWAVYLIYSVVTMRTRQSVYRLLIAAAAVIVMVILAFTNDTLYLAVFRMSGDYGRSDIVWKRLYANFDIVVGQNGLIAWIGNGLGNIASEFMNSIVYMLLNVGYIGTALVVFGFVRAFLHSKLLGKMSIIVLGMLACIDMVLFTPTAMGYLMIFLNDTEAVPKVAAPVSKMNMTRNENGEELTAKVD